MFVHVINGQNLGEIVDFTHKHRQVRFKEQTHLRAAMETAPYILGYMPPYTRFGTAAVICDIPGGVFFVIRFQNFAISI